MVPFHCQPSAGKSSETCCTVSPPKMTTKSNYFPIASNYRQIWRPNQPMNLIESSTIGGVKEHNDIVNKYLDSQKESTWSTRKHSSRLRTTHFCSILGRDMGPEISYTLERTWDQGSGRDMAPEIPYPL